MAEGEVLIGELLTVDGLASSPIASSEVTALAHEVRDHTVEGPVIPTRHVPHVISKDRPIVLEIHH